MDITSPYFVVAVIVIAFAVSILFATSSKVDDEHEEHDDHCTRRFGERGRGRPRYSRPGGRRYILPRDRWDPNFGDAALESFSGVFHASMIIFSSAACNSAFWVQLGFPSHKSGDA